MITLIGCWGRWGGNSPDSLDIGGGASGVDSQLWSESRLIGGCGALIVTAQFGSLVGRNRDTGAQRVTAFTTGATIAARAMVLGPVASHQGWGVVAGCGLWCTAVNTRHA